MPTQHVAADKMGVGSKGSGKHWTQAEVAARQAAAEGMKRKTRIVMKEPDWLSDEARKVWKKVRRDVASLELLDNLDAEMLAIYCDAVVKHREASRALTVASTDEAIKAVQAWARLVASYADKLGFTPAARARLAKKKADETQDSFGDEFDG